MSRGTRLFVLLVSTPLVALVIVGGLLGASATAPQQGVRHLKVFEDVVSLILGAYVEEVNIDKVMNGAMRGLADGLDSATSYLTPEEVRAIDANATAGSADVGLIINRQFYLRVLGVREGSPAQKAGITTGDFIRAIGDTPTRDMSTWTGTRLLRGAPGSKVSLLVIRGGNTADPHQVELVREVPPAQRVATRRLPGGEVYLRLGSIDSTTAAAVRAALTSAPRPAGGPQPTVASSGRAENGLVLDLRGTADGTPEDGVSVARLFVKGGGVLATRAGRSKEDRRQTLADDGDGALAMPLVVLVSDGTANAAEVLAAAVGGNKRGVLVGEVTAGLAAHQKLVRLPEGHGMWLTDARYMQVDGTPIHERGIRPDVPVEVPTVAWDEVPPATDVTLDRGVEELKKALVPAPVTSNAPASRRPTDPTNPTTPPASQGAPATGPR